MGAGLGLVRAGPEMGVQSPDQVQFFWSNPFRNDKSRPYLAWPGALGPPETGPSLMHAVGQILVKS